MVLVAAAVLLSGPVHAGPPVAPAPLVRIPFPQDDGSLTPYTFELGYPLVTLVYDTLLWRDREGVPRPWLADSVDSSDDGRRLTVRLVDGVRWHDGAPLTSADVAFTFRYVADHPHPRFTPSLAAVDRVEVLDGATVEIRLHHPSPGFADQPLADLPILPAHLWKTLAPGAAAPDGLPVGSGPYRLVEHRPGTSYRFEANPDYFRGRPTVAAVEVPVVRGVDDTLQALRARQVDMIPVGLPEAASAIVRAPGTRVEEGVSYLGTVLMFNLRRPPFDRPEVRRAVAGALDLRRVARAAGRAVPADRGYLHPRSRWAAEEVLHRFDPIAAGTLAALDLPPIEIVVSANDPVRLEAARQVVLALQRSGVRASSRSVPREELARAVGEDGSPPSFQAAIWGAPPLASYDPDFLGRIFGSDPGHAPLNYSGYSSGAFDGLVERVSTTADPAARRAAVGDQLRLLARDLPVVPLFFATGRYAFRPAIHDGWVFVKGSGILDKRSFTEGAPAAPTTPSTAPTRTSSGGGVLGFLAAGLLAVALLLCAWLVVGAVRARSR